MATDPVVTMLQLAGFHLMCVNDNTFPVEMLWRIKQNRYPGEPVLGTQYSTHTWAIFSNSNERRGVYIAKGWDELTVPLPSMELIQQMIDYVASKTL